MTNHRSEPTGVRAGRSRKKRAAASQRPRIGEILVDAGKLAAEQVDRALDHQAARGLRFGEAAIELGMLAFEDVESALAWQRASAPREAEPAARSRSRSTGRSSVKALVPSAGSRAVTLAGRRLGEILVALGKLQPMDVTRILGVQTEGGGLFGAIAVRLSLVSEADLQGALARQFDYPYLVDGSSPVSREVVAAYAPFGAEGEALRGLRSELLTRWFEHAQGGRALAVVSPDRGEGRSYLAANLAITLSQLGKRTLLVDADLRNPRQHAIFALDNTSGLSAVLSGRGDSRAVQQISPFDDLYILPAGILPPNPQELLARAEFRAAIGALEREFGAIVVDTPAGTLSADARTISGSTRGALMVVRQDRSRAQALASFSRSLEAADVSVVGAVMNRA